MKTRFLFASLALVALGACSTQRVSIQSEVLDAKAAKLKVIHVAGNPLSASSGVARCLGEFIGKTAASDGYSLSKSADESELVLLPTLSKIQSGAEPPSPSPGARAGIANSDQGLLARESGFVRGRTSFSVTPEFSFALIVSAFERSAWTGAVSGTEIPKVWSVTAFVAQNGRDKPGDSVRKLVEAAVPWFGRSSNGVVAVPVK
ncbi:MAG: hypothetical protein WC003_05490 [Terrimicrobiaceae bacterium]|jgi:hypothetical protein